VLTISRAFSAGELTSPKSGKARRTPLVDDAAAALKRLRERGDFTGRTDWVFVNVFGRHLNDSAVRRRYKAAQKVAKLRPLRFHDLRHTYGSLLAAGGVDPVAIQAAYDHADINTTMRYLHARPATEQAKRFSEAFRTAGQAAVPSP